MSKILWQGTVDAWVEIDGCEAEAAIPARVRESDDLRCGFEIEFQQGDGEWAADANLGFRAPDPEMSASLDRQLREAGLLGR